MTSAQQKTDFMGRARSGWGGKPPDWVIALAEACRDKTQTKVAQQLGVSPSQVSQILANKYPVNLDTIAEKVRGAFLGSFVECPRKGAMRRDVCLQWQGKPFAATSADRVAMYRACRSGCPHSRLKEG
ncbi:helix-turn-helix domain-containing protein [Methylobacterium aquaticum]|uniref:helix-turn-helix domain-containing protein n=1 Tax=Methylobacterium aquaticum TaxID=270351 RepID=UPI003D16376F